MKREFTLYLTDIIECIEYVESFSKGLTLEKFMHDQLRQSAIMRKIEIMGEAVKNIPKEIRIKYPEVEWKEIAATRDILIHAYPGIKADWIWNIVKDDLPALKKQVTEILENEK